MKRPHTPEESPTHPEKKVKLSSDPPASSQAKLLPYPSPGRALEPVPFQQPQQLLTFSYTPEHVLEFTNSALRYYVPPPPGADLKYGYDRWIKRPEERGRIDSLLRAVGKVRKEMDRGEESVKGEGTEWLRSIGVVSWRGVMTKILTAPYEDRDGWELNVMHVDGTLYFEEHSTETRLQEKNNLPPHQRQQTYYGYSFESYCTSSSPHKSLLPGHAPGWGGDVDTNVQWCSVVKTKLADTRLVIGGEVDCVREKYTSATNTFVELKTSLNIRHAQDEARFEKKLLKFYFQSFLLGVPEIVVGFRSPQGRLGTVQTFKTVEIPRMVRGKPHAWDPVRCLDWAKKFLAFLRDTVTPVSLDGRPAAHTESSSSSSPSEARNPSPESSKDDGTTETTSKPATVSVWRVTFTPGTGVSISQLGQAGVDEVEAGEERVGFLPKWYFDELKARNEGASSAESTGGAGKTEEKDAEEGAGEAEKWTGPATVKEDGSGSGSGSVGALPSGWQI